MLLFQRKAYSRLLQWKKESQGHSAILVEGARRVGKSTLVRHFAEQEYASHLIIDFSEVPDAVRELFETRRGDVQDFFKYLRAFYPQFRPVERNTLIVLDEVQLCPPARSFIKQLVADGRYDYVETGSLISIKDNVKNILIPSEEDAMTLSPMDFEEFLWAVGRDGLFDVIRDSYNELQPLPDGLHRLAGKLFREYMLIGGMPQSVEAYIQQDDFHAADLEKRRILTLYGNDIAKYGGGERQRVTAIFRTIPGQLSKHEKKFTMTSLGETARYDSYSEAFFWLSEAGLVNMCFNATDPSVGLGMSLDDSSFKCYMADTGLLVTHAFANNIATSDELYRDILFDKLDFNEGMLVENVVAQQLKASGHELFFFSRTDRETSRNRMEIDFLMARPYENAAMKTRISPIEVKSGSRYRTVSLDKFKERYGSRIGRQFVLHPKPLKVDGDRVYLPLYMAGLL